MRTSYRLSLALALALACGCSSEATPSPAISAQEAGADTARDDAATSDAGLDSAPVDGPSEAAPETGPDAVADTAPDTAPDTAEDAPLEDSSPDASADVVEEASDDAPGDALACVPLAGMGEVICVCNELDDQEWNASLPFLFNNHLDLGTAGWDEASLTPGGAKIVADGNLGGSSIESEVVAYEVLGRCEFAALLKTEGEIQYQNTGGKKTDLLLQIDGRKVGVSVTRAYHYPPGEPYTSVEANTLLQKKLADIPLSAANAVAADAWERSMLSVIAYDEQHAAMIESAWSQLDAPLRADTILVVTVTDGDDLAIY